MQFICTSATIAFICFCLYKYSQNDDVSQVTFQEFHKKKDNLYPSVSICLSSIFYEENLKSYGDGINISTYTDFMSGEYWDDRIDKVDYDNVTLNFSNYLLGVMVFMELPPVGLNCIAIAIICNFLLAFYLLC